MKGWVYVISNPSMPGVVKVGYSMKDPSIRANDLDSTGMPTAYRVEYEALVEEPYQVEQQIHHEMQAFHAGKEWFKTDTLNAVLAIRRCAGSVFFENYRELAEYEIRIKEAEAACKAEQDSFRSWRESIREIYTSELAYEQSAARSKIEKKFAELAFECFLIPRSTAIIFGFVAGISKRSSRWDGRPSHDRAGGPGTGLHGPG